MKKVIAAVLTALLFASCSGTANPELARQEFIRQYLRAVDQNDVRKTNQLIRQDPGTALEIEEQLRQGRRPKTDSVADAIASEDKSEAHNEFHDELAPDDLLKRFETAFKHRDSKETTNLFIMNPHNAKKVQLYLQKKVAEKATGWEEAGKLEQILSVLAEKLYDNKTESERLKMKAALLIMVGKKAYENSEYEEALAIWKRGLSASEKMGNDTFVMNTLGLMGAVYEDLGEYDNAFIFLDKAIALSRKIRNRRFEGINLTNLGAVHLSVGNYEKAGECFHQVLKISRGIKNKKLEGAAKSSLGIVNMGNGNYETALDYLNESLQIRRDLGDKKSESDDLTNIGLVYWRLQDHEKALFYFNQSLILERSFDDQKRVSNDLSNMGLAYLGLGNPRQAADAFHQSLVIRKKLNHQRGESAALTNLALAYKEAGEYDKALKFGLQGLEMGKKLNIRGDLAIITQIIGDICLLKKDFSRSRRFFERSVSLSAETDTPEALWEARRGLGRTELAGGNDEKAVSYFEQSVATIESLRSGLSERDNRSGFMRNKLVVYDELLGLLDRLHEKYPRKGYDRKAFEFFERKQGRIFLEDMGKSGARNYAGLPQELRQKESELTNQLAAMKSELREEKGKEAGRRSDKRIRNIGKRIRELRNARNETEAEIKKQYPDYYALKHPSPVTLKKLQQNVLAPGEILLVYNVMEKKTLLWVISKKHFRFYPIRTDEQNLSEKVAKFRKGPETVLEYMEKGCYEGCLEHRMGLSADEFGNISHELYNLLLPRAIRPLLSAARTLYIIPTGPLYSLPFEALASRFSGASATERDKKESRYLIEDVPISYLSSASLLKIIRDSQKRKKGSASSPLIAFANPVYKDQSGADGQRRSSGRGGKSELNHLRTLSYQSLLRGEFAELPETETEARDIMATLGAPESSLQIREAASRSNVLRFHESEQLDDYRYIVFACHGILPGEIDYISQPALVLSHPDPENGKEGFLTMADVLGIRLNAELVTLSACNTGRGRLQKGEGVRGLTRSFMYAGTPAVSVTLWSVESQSARYLSTGLYQGLNAGKNRARALRDVKLKMIRGKAPEGKEGRLWQHPFFWAPVVIFGDGS